jgi:RimJ/RimL family protein N-acetyltransferase
MNPIVNKAWNPAERIVTNRVNGLGYRMVPARSVAPGHEQLVNLVSACNEPAVFEFLFRKLYGGRPYELDDARKFFSWASQGWQEQTHFVFVLLAPSGLIAAALDIKSADRNMAEIGYWCSALHRGLMSSAVSELKCMARDENFKALFARVRKDNIASIKVLERNGFILQGDWPGDPNRSRFEVVL